MVEGDGAMAAHEGGSSARRHGNLLECKHPIFLSQSGAQKSFVEQLSLDIERHDRYPFFDKRRDSLSIGCNFPEEIFKAIKECHVAVVVLSEEFFTRSKWPMLELASLVKRKKGDSKLIIMPVYLGLTNAQCRDKLKQKKWMRKWKNWAEIDDRIDLGEWKDIFKMFGPTNGIFLNDELNEVKCREEIVEAICKEVPPRSRWDDSHVQGRSNLILAICGRIDGMEASKSYGARSLGIYGVGGVGKTTGCKVLCNEYFEEFEGNVCHIEFGSGSKLQRLQEVLKRLTKTNHEVIKSFSEDECKDRMKWDLVEKVFLAIDNVQAVHHIVEEARDFLRMGFIQGSIVIVMARSRDLLSSLNLEECMEMPDLDEDDASSLFLYHGGVGSYPRNVMSKNLLKKCLERCYFSKGDGKRCHYHPLALKVLGGQLGNDPKSWMEKLSKPDPFNQYQEKVEEHPVFSILGRSFEMLGEEDQLLFMDVAIFSPHQLWYPMNHNIFEWLSGVHGKSLYIIKQKLEGLKSKSLVEHLGDGSEEIGMHDLWREFAVMKLDKCKFASRLWFYKKIYGLKHPKREEPKLSRGNGWGRLERICMVGDKPNECIVKDIEMSCYSNLQVLKLVDVILDSWYLDVSLLRDLKSLQIYSDSISNPILEIVGLGVLERLVFLHFEGTRIRTRLLLKEIEGLISLRVLHIWSVDSSSVLPDSRRLKSLRDVSFIGFESGDMISGLSSNMTDFERLDLSVCISLRSCYGVGDLVFLKVLDLSGCKNLEELPDLGRLKHLLKLDIRSCSGIGAVPGLGDLISLREFEAWGCGRLAELPDMHKFVNMRVLSLGGCPLIKAIPGLSNMVALESVEVDCERLQGCDDLRKLVKLERVEIRGWGAEGVPCLLDLVNLKSLELFHAEPELSGVSNLSRIQELRIIFCNDIVDLSWLSNLTALMSLRVFWCSKLVKLPDMRMLFKLELLDIKYCRSLREWGSGSGLRLSGVDLHSPGSILPQLRRMDLSRVSFAELPDLINFPQLRELDILDCEELTSLTSSAPLTALKHLLLWNCKRLRALPDVNHLVSLTRFELKGCGEVELTADEIVKLEAMCLELELDKCHLQNTQLVNDDCGRDAKRLKSVETIELGCSKLQSSSL